MEGAAGREVRVGGDVLIKMRAKAKVLHTFAMLEGKEIDVAGGGRIAIEALPHISLIEVARNCRIEVARNCLGAGSSGSTNWTNNGHLEFGGKSRRGVQLDPCAILLRLLAQYGLVSERWESLAMRADCAIFSFRAVEVGGALATVRNLKLRDTSDDRSGYDDACISRMP